MYLPTTESPKLESACRETSRTLACFRCCTIPQHKYRQWLHRAVKSRQSKSVSSNVRSQDTEHTGLHTLSFPGQYKKNCACGNRISRESTSDKSKLTWPHLESGAEYSYKGFPTEPADTNAKAFSASRHL